MEPHIYVEFYIVVLYTTMRRRMSQAMYGAAYICRRPHHDAAHRLRASAHCMHYHHVVEHLQMNDVLKNYQITFSAVCVVP